MYTLLALNCNYENSSRKRKDVAGYAQDFIVCLDGRVSWLQLECAHRVVLIVNRAVSVAGKTTPN